MILVFEDERTGGAAPVIVVAPKPTVQHQTTKVEKFNPAAAALEIMIIIMMNVSFSLLSYRSTELSAEPTNWTLIVIILFTKGGTNRSDDP